MGLFNNNKKKDAVRQELTTLPARTRDDIPVANRPPANRPWRPAQRQSVLRTPAIPTDRDVISQEPPESLKEAFTKLKLDTPVRCMREGTGGTFALVDQSLVTDTGNNLLMGKVHALDPGRYLGIRECWTGIGVFFEIANDYCFCAHMSIKFDKDYASREDLQQIADAVRDRLRRYSRQQGWELNEVHRKSVMVICQSPHQAQITEAVTYGVREFLGFLQNEVKIMRYVSGFVHQHDQSTRSTRIQLVTSDAVGLRVDPLPGYKLGHRL